MTVNIKHQQLDKNVFLDHAKSSFQTWEKTASMQSGEFHQPLIRSAYSHPSHTLHCITWNSQSCHSKSLGADGCSVAHASQQKLWCWFSRRVTTSHEPRASLPAWDQVAASVLSQWFRIYKGNSFYSWSILLPAKQILIGEQCQMPMRKVCACSVIQGVWPRFSFTTKLMQHLY